MLAHSAQILCTGAQQCENVVGTGYKHNYCRPLKSSAMLYTSFFGQILIMALGCVSTPFDHLTLVYA